MAEIKELTARFADALAKQAAKRFRGEVADMALESPIEVQLAAALLFALKSDDHFHWNDGVDNWVRPADLPGGGGIPKNRWGIGDDGIHVHCQRKIGKYTADFLVDFKLWRGASSRVVAVIECDGHDFHERTKKQAAHDKARDRHFQDLGLMVLRYTGSEIYRDPLKVALDALNILLRRANAQADAAGESLWASESDA